MLRKDNAITLKEYRRIKSKLKMMLGIVGQGKE
jgi:hypothetical protein